MQNKLVNTDESINIDELEKSKTISLTSNRSPVSIYAEVRKSKKDFQLNNSPFMLFLEHEQAYLKRDCLPLLIITQIFLSST